MARKSKVNNSHLSESWDDVAESIEEVPVSRKTSRAGATKSWVDSVAGSIPEEPQSLPNPYSPPRPKRASGPLKNQSAAPSIPSPTAPRRRSTRNSRAPSVDSSVPEFIYPQVEGSWIDTETSTPRKRNVRSQVINEEFANDRPPSNPSTPRRKKQQQIEKKRTNPSLLVLYGTWNYLIGPVLYYLAGIFGLILQWLAPLVAIVVAGGITILAVQAIFSKLVPSLAFSIPDLGAIGSPCTLPIVSLMPFCQKPISTSGRPEFEELVKVQATFEDVLQSAARGAELPLDMKRSEAGIRDLRYLVAYSNLPSRNELVYVFEEFISTARQASADLTKFNSRINRATDHIISTNRYTLQVLDGYTSYEQSRGAVSRFMSSLSIVQPRLTEASILKQYLRHAESVEDEIVALIDQAQTLLQVLQGLDNHLDLIHGVCTRDGVRVQENLDELFAQLWTKLGGNRNSKGKLDKQMQLLKDVGAYRKLAWAHVSGTILKLQQIQAGLEDLRERVVLPDTLPEIPLEQHIDTIQLGVQRLEEQRNEARKLETETYRRIMDRPGELDKARLVDGKA